MYSLIPNDVGFTLLILVPIILFVAFVAHAKLKPSDATNSKARLISLGSLKGSIAALVYIAFDLYVLQGANCTNWCGIENIFAAMIAGSVTIFSFFAVLFTTRKKPIPMNYTLPRENRTVLMVLTTIAAVSSLLIAIHPIKGFFTTLHLAFTAGDYWQLFELVLFNGPLLTLLPIIFTLWLPYLIIKENYSVAKLIGILSLISVTYIFLESYFFRFGMIPFNFIPVALLTLYSSYLIFFLKR